MAPETRSESAGYAYQAVDHDASITAVKHPDDRYQVIIEITRGEKKPVRIAMWDEDLARMTGDVLGVRRG
jgi:hypothetical protein